MKHRLALLAFAAAASPALACPPPYYPPDQVPPSVDQLLRNRAEATPNIVYATVERSIPAWREDLSAQDLGMLRILHVYKGNLRAGQLIPMYGQVSLNDCMYQYNREQAVRGTSGLIFLDAWDGSEPLAFESFQVPEVARDLIRIGVIQSAQAASTRR